VQRLTRDSRTLTNSQKKKTQTPAKLVQRLTRDSRTLTVALPLKSQCLSIFAVEGQCLSMFTLENQCVEVFFFSIILEAIILLCRWSKPR
jgi:hypothetical protein